MKVNNKSQKKTDKIFIPTLGEISIGAGTVPSSGVTASIKKLNQAFERATREHLIPPPPSEQSNTS